MYYMHVRIISNEEYREKYNLKHAILAFSFCR